MFHTSLPSKVRLLSCLVALSAAGAFAACSATNDGNTFNEGGDASSGKPSGSGSGQGGSGVGGDDIGNVSATSTGSGNGVGGGSCAAESKTAEQLPLDMYIMLDQSGSMSETVSGGGTRWDAVKSALITFVNEPSTAGIGVGIQYFALPDNSMSCPATCTTDADCGAYGPCFPGFGCIQCVAGAESCNPADYAKPDVEIASLPGVAPQIVQSINNHGPSTNTPTSAALQGAIDHAKEWAIAHPDHVVIDVLATDGEPSECDTNQANIDAIAAAGANGTPKILTFVIGVGSGAAVLNGTAQAGGTGQAFIVDTNQDVNQQFLDALNQIRGAALSCNYLIPVPEAGTPDFNAVNVQYTPGDGSAPQIFPKVADKASCPPGGDAWYYDNNAMPTQIIMCDGTCDKISSDKMGKLDILLGCETIVK